MSSTVLVSAITSFLGFLISSAATFLVLSRGRKIYHFLFASVLLSVAIWDLGIFACMIRNRFSNELPIYYFIIAIPCTLLPALVYHFTCSYLNQPRKKSTIFIWAFCIWCSLGQVPAIFDPHAWGKISGVYNFSWGNYVRPDTVYLIQVSIWLLLYYIFVWSSCWFLFRAYRQEPSPTNRRHILYILISLLVISLAHVKFIVLYGVDNRYMLPTGMLLIDIFGALIGVAIIKHRLFDITLIVKKGTLYSLLAALIIFVFSCSEHLLSKYLGDLLGEQPIYIYLISIAIVVGVFMPVRQRLERTIEGFFATKKVEF